MLSRRHILAGLCSCAFCQPGQAESSAKGGCYLTADEFKTLTDGSKESFDYAFSGFDKRRRSGDPDFDKALAITLLKLTDTFQILPDFMFYQEKGSSMNAVATGSIERRDRPDGAVAYGLNLLGLQKQGELGGIPGVIAVCAHEFGHVVQMKRGTRAKLVTASGQVYRNELHADYLAGYFVGLKKLENTTFPAAEVALAVYSLGDSSFESRGHHGTREQRGEAVRQGFLRSHRDHASFDEAFESGFKYAQSIKRAG